MRTKANTDTSLFEVVEDNGRLIVRTRPAPYTPVLRIFAWLTGVATVSGNGSVQSLQDNSAGDARFYAVEAFH